MTQIQLSERLNCNPLTVANIVKAVESYGLLYRQRDEIDGRVNRVYSTAKGQDIKGPIENTWRTQQDKLLDGIPSAERILVKKLMKRMADNIYSKIFRSINEHAYDTKSRREWFSVNVFVVGANGQIGQHLVKLLKESKEHTVRVMVRKKEQAEAFEKQGIETRIADLEGSVEEIVEAAKGCDAIVFTAGSGGHTGADKTLLIDLDGAAKTIEAAEEIGVKRFVMVSVIHAHRREKWSSIKPYMVAKHYADKILEKSGLPYTIIRPGGLLNEPGTGKILVGEDLERASIPREDVARTIVAVLTKEATFNRSFDLVSGEKAILDALDNSQ